MIMKDSLSSRKKKYPKIDENFLKQDFSDLKRKQKKSGKGKKWIIKLILKHEIYWENDKW